MSVLDQLALWSSTAGFRVMKPAHVCSLRFGIQEPVCIFVVQAQILVCTVFLCVCISLAISAW